MQLCTVVVDHPPLAPAHLPSQNFYRMPLLDLLLLPLLPPPTPFPSTSASPPRGGRPRLPSPPPRFLLINRLSNSCTTPPISRSPTPATAAAARRQVE